MNDPEFVDFCFQKILRRNTDSNTREAFTQRLAHAKVSREQLLIEFLDSPEFVRRNNNQECFEAGHFFSAIPSAEERAAYRRNLETCEIGGIDLNLSEQRKLLRIFAEYPSECVFPSSQAPEFRYYSENASFPLADAYVLSSFIRHFCPKRLIEVGSGFSSAAALDTIDRTRGIATHCTFIEPYPALLNTLLRPEDDRHTIIPQPLQAVDLALFESLAANDILFIDSTHVSKLNSDVNRAIFDILPRLKPGVLVHIHDIYWPFDYPEEWVHEGRAWNEAYLVRAFLQFNKRYKILYFSSYLHPRERSNLKSQGSFLGKNDGGSLWLRVQE